MMPSIAADRQRHRRVATADCCGGRRTLGQACAAADLDPDTVIEELMVAGCPQPVEAWTTMGAAQLVGHIEDIHHRYLWDELPRLTALGGKVLDVHGERHPELHDVAACLSELRADLEPHLLKEERVLFPMIRGLTSATCPPAFHCGSIRNPIGVMMREHDNAGVLLERLHGLTDCCRPPADACSSFGVLYLGLAELEADTHLHIHKGNNLLFPMVERIEAGFRNGTDEGGEAPCFAHLLDEDGAPPER